jgi:hypothetical protein
MKMTGKHDGMALAERVRKALGDKRNMTEKRMMDGVCFLLRKHMLCGTAKQGYLFRVGKEQNAEALARLGATALAFSAAKPSFVWVEPDACDARALKGWIALATRYVETLPPKKD